MYLFICDRVYYQRDKKRTHVLNYIDYVLRPNCIFIPRVILQLEENSQTMQKFVCMSLYTTKNFLVLYLISFKFDCKKTQNPSNKITAQKQKLNWNLF